MADDALYYVYGIVGADFDATGAPPGIEDALVSTFRHAPVAALLSRLSRHDYSVERLEQNSGNVSWMGPRAMAHDRVLTWAQTRGTVIPLPMLSLWGNDDALSKSLADNVARLTTVFDRVAGADEFGLRLHRRDDMMLRSIAELDDEMARLRAAAEAASPGQRYLLERKLAEQGKGAVRAASQRLAKQVFEELRAVARDAVSRPLVPQAAGGSTPDATLVLNAAFLVERARLDDFRAAVGAQVRTLEPHGLTFDFTGPWPPYNFVAAADGGTPMSAGAAT